jgi:hypothetical protein
MWAPWLSANFHILRRDIVDQNITLEEIIAMWDTVKE